MKLIELKWPDVEALSKDTPVVIPIAAHEQHGHHMPLHTDSLLLGEITRRAEEQRVAWEREKERRSLQAIQPPLALFLHDEPAARFQQAEKACLALVAGLNVGLEGCADEPLERLFQALILDSARLAVGGDHQLTGAEAHSFANFLAPVLAVHELAHAENQNVLVEDRRQTNAGWDYRQGVVA